MTDLTTLKSANAERWAKAKVVRNFSSVARALVEPQAKARYQVVERRAGVPWFVIAVIHEREASQRWDRQLGQGDPLYEVSTHVPAGRGPFKTWEDGAVDALVNCAPFAARNKDWSIGGLLMLLEQYNGLGYFEGPVTKKNGVVIARYPSQASPYIWSGTDQYKSGKYVADHVFDPRTIDVQLGCAGLLMAMMDLDSSISFGAKPTPANSLPPRGPIPIPDLPDVHPPEPKPVPLTGWAALFAFILSLFKRS